MKFFKTSDFTDARILKECIRLNWQPEEIAKMCNEKLERESKAVYGLDLAGMYGPFQTDHSKYKAVIICIEPIEKCKHIDAFHYTRITNDGPDYLLAHCSLCHAKFKMTEIT